MDKRELIAQLIALDLPKDEYVVVGGGVLTAHHIRDTADIDLVVSPDLFCHLQVTWNQKIRPNGKIGLYQSCFEAYLDVNCGDSQESFQTLLASSELIAGIHFMHLSTLAEFKRNYGRNKDLSDLNLIAEFQNNK
ncbi:zinc ABC transporter substrate-binding protein [Acinetobacter proteolyticus]|uniref:Zinc ABC transporter substrate-binding protein n=1 Tax=Acinetobacter proteolyticus TaxID=1776741 RepID=A0A2N0WA12_9GAMM|nr:zinc ABC transporter substrate-binding protein [Acinetobacter proteolyticus]MBK5646987.1 zinc ABC transporter substrate-binding protein [Acinetobacter sp.]PKF31294.1 zinc ABC transporter substrate-binding protein [Acinetobacter proteolyticus]